ncbi:organic solute transporter alpha-like protein 1 isoform X2 [Dreissena polymorpha]|uniref:organic solute transporter alpha-like protein 1 isoform X2 n=1 Tax=Dreissena polymorpha TaxID=45954 RepID=UPI002264BC27|nr:organic solute transporter alpha-like protein 1 isoform X2 [Dreissena polymorpha]
MTNCSNEYPSTDVYYPDVSSDIVLVIGLCIGSMLMVICLAIFVEEIVFIRKHYYDNVSTGRMMLVLLGLFPVICTTRMVSVFVPTSNVLMNLLSSCYIAVCIYAYISMTISLFGGREMMISILAKCKISIVPKLCYRGLRCLFKPINMTKKSFRTFELLAMQFMFVRPFLLLIEAVFRTDKRTETAKNLVFNILAELDIPACLNSFGPRLRASNFNNLLLVLESFILCLIAHRGYRIVPTKHILDPGTTENEPNELYHDTNMAATYL